METIFEKRLLVNIIFTSKMEEGVWVRFKQQTFTFLHRKVIVL